MSLLNRLSFGWRTRLPVLLQSEATECGLACLGMIAAAHGHRTDLASLRNRFPVSLKGATLAQLVQVAARMELAARPLKLELGHLPQLRLPCVLHWNFNHFVVLKAVRGDSIVIHDPASGERTVPMDEVSRAFTGVALELWPTTQFKPQDETRTVTLRQLMGRVTGLRRSFGLILVLALALELFGLVSPFYLQWVIDNVLASADRDLLATLALGFGLLLVMQQVLAAGRGWMLMYLGTTLNVQWRANVFTHLLRLPMQYFEKRHLGDIVSRVAAIDQIERTLTTSFLEAILDGVFTIAILAMMFLYSPMLAAIAVGAMLLYALGRWLWFRPLRSATEEEIVHAARQQSHFLETVRGVKVIKLFQRQDERRARWLNLLVDQVNANLRSQKLMLVIKSMNGLLFGLENVLIIYLGAGFVLDGNFTVGVFIAFNAYKMQFDSRVAALIDKLFEIRMLRLQGERLADIVLTEPEPAASLLDDGASRVPSLETRGLRFRYGEGEAYVLDGVDLRIDAGESVAIVGPSGCGKSTLMNVLLGILPATEGQLLVGGDNLGPNGIEALRAMVGTVLQDDSLFAGSIGENISFFDPAADPAWIAECAGVAAVAADIAAMPMGYNTLIGDMGTVLSGGQKQRILLARALYKRPRILFLDEATSHLDVERERQVNQAISALRITRVIIAHRPETIASADRVVVLHAGKVVTTRPAPFGQACA